MLGFEFKDGTIYQKIYCKPKDWVLSPKIANVSPNMEIQVQILSISPNIRVAWLTNSVPPVGHLFCQHTFDSTSV